MGTRQVYEEKLRRGNLDYDPTMNPGLGSARCPRCLSLLNPNSVSCQKSTVFFGFVLEGSENHLLVKNFSGERRVDDYSSFARCCCSGQFLAFLSHSSTWEILFSLRFKIVLWD